MPRVAFAIPLVFAVLVAPLARAEDLPIIVTYELKKQRQEARAAQRDPRAFWIRQVATRIAAKAAELPTRLKAPVTAHVTFVVGRDGRLVSKAIATPSGDATVDKAALAMVDHAQPFPPMPTTMSDADLTFTLPVRFR